MGKKKNGCGCNFLSLQTIVSLHSHQALFSLRSDSPLTADAWLLNSCTVKGPSEDSLKNSIRKGRELGKPLVVAGCVPQGQRNHPDIRSLSVVGVSGDRVLLTFILFSSLLSAWLPLLYLIFPSSPRSPQVQQIDRVVEVMEETLKGMLK